MDTITNTSRITSSLKLEIEDPNQTNKAGGALSQGLAGSLVIVAL